MIELDIETHTDLPLAYTSEHNTATRNLIGLEEDVWWVTEKHVYSSVGSSPCSGTSTSNDFSSFM